MTPLPRGYCPVCGKAVALPGERDGARAHVHVRKGQRVLVDAGRGVQLSIERYASGAVDVRNEISGTVLRQWAPKEARRP